MGVLVRMEERSLLVVRRTDSFALAKGVLDMFDMAAAAVRNIFTLHPSSQHATSLIFKAGPDISIFDITNKRPLLKSQPRRRRVAATANEGSISHLRRSVAEETSSDRKLNLEPRELW